MLSKPTYLQYSQNSLGDSGFVIIGPGKVTYRSEMQTHAFNTPYQMSKVPPRMQAQHAIFGGSTHFSETPQDADVTKHKVQHGDVEKLPYPGFFKILGPLAIDL